MTIIETINEGLKKAMLGREQVRLDTLRMLKSKILAVDARGALPDEDVRKLFKTYYGNLQEALEHAETAKRSETIEKLKQEMAIVQEFLPSVPSAEETKQLIIQAIAETGAKTKRDFGLVMKGIMKLNQAVDGKLAKELASQLLPDS